MAEYIREIRHKNNNGVTYQVAIYYESDGERKLYKKNFNSDKYVSKIEALNEAKIHRDKMLYRLRSSHYKKDGDQTLKEVFDLTNLTLSHAPQTIRKVTSILNRYIKPLIPLETRFSDINYLDILKTLTEAQNKASDNILERLHSLWKQMYTVAIMNDITQINETTKIVRPKSKLPQKSGRRQTTNLKEIQEVIESLKYINDEVLKEKIELVIWIMFYTGIRPAECLALNKSDFNLSELYVKINKSIRINEKRDGYVSSTKTPSSIRDIPITNELADMIRSKEDGPLFIYRGKYLTSTFIGDMIRKHYKGEFTLYKLRHQFATDMISSMVDIRTIQELMGHSRSSTTVSYMRSDNDKMRDAINKRRSS